jgi:hypothetical protein
MQHIGIGRLSDSRSSVDGWMYVMIMELGTAVILKLSLPCQTSNALIQVGE